MAKTRQESDWFTALAKRANLAFAAIGFVLVGVLVVLGTVFDERLKEMETSLDVAPMTTAPFDAPLVDHPKRLCLDLLYAKQEALDRGVPFPLPQHELCERCHSVFATLNLTQRTFQQLHRDGNVTPEVRRALREELGREYAAWEPLVVAPSGTPRLIVQYHHTSCGKNQHGRVEALYIASV